MEQDHDSQPLGVDPHQQLRQTVEIYNDAWSDVADDTLSDPDSRYAVAEQITQSAVSREISFCESIQLLELLGYKVSGYPSADQERSILDKYYNGRKVRFSSSNHAKLDGTIVDEPLVMALPTEAVGHPIAAAILQLQIDVHGVVDVAYFPIHDGSPRGVEITDD